MRRVPIRLRITLVAALVMMAALLVFGVVFLRVVHSSQLTELRTNSKRRADDVAALVRAGTATGRLPAARDDSLLVQVIDPNGTVAASSQNVSDMHAFIEGGGHAVPPGHLRHFTVNVEKIPCELLVTGADSGSKHYEIYVAAPLRSIRHTQDMLRSRMLRLSPLVLLGSLIAMWSIATRALRPVEVMRREVDAISAADLSARVSSPPVDDELGRLARTMNAMLERVQHASDRQARFVSDASHELRTPLAITRARLEVALRNQKRTDWPAAANDVLRESGRMERLVRDLLALARGGPELEKQGPVDLDEVVLEAVKSARLLAPPGCVIEARGVSAGRVLGHADLLERVVANLLTNGLRHARSMVKVSLSHAADDPTLIELTVSDDGPGVAPPERERIFERFTRLDEARDRQSGGAGLGLAIVAEVVGAHRGTVHVEGQPGGGARFVVRIPALD